MKLKKNIKGKIEVVLNINANSSRGEILSNEN